MEVKLQRPIDIKGEKVEKIVLNLDSLTGKDILSVNQELRLRGVVGMNTVFTTEEGLMIVASKVSGILPDDLERLSAPDFLEVTAQVSNFLMGWASPGKTPSQTSEKPE